MNKKFITGLSTWVLILTMSLSFVACKTEKDSKATNSPEGRLVQEVSEKYAPDKRVALFDVSAEKEGEFVVLKGETNIPEAIEELKSKFESKNISFRDSIQLLPSEDLKGRTQGVIRISVANLRSKPSHSAELVTQATLGTPVSVYKKDGGWYYIQTPDGYLAWVDNGGLTTFSNDEMEKWREAEKIVFLEPFGFSYATRSNEGQVVTDLVAGNVLEVISEAGDFYEIRYPDGKHAFVEKSLAKPYQNWIASLEPTGENLTATAKRLMGVPYLWGGTSPKGMDCSGFTKTVFFLNGMVLPRDASQQIVAGKTVDSTKNFENLKAGDLLYFGRKATDTTPERIIHVGMWIGDKKFIHSMGDVHISTFDTTAKEFDAYNYNRYLKTKRVLGREDEEIIELAESDLFTTPGQKTADLPE